MDRNAYIGKIVIAGFTYYDESGKYLDQKQYHGIIIDVDAANGIRFRDVSRNEEHVLPPRVDALFPAPPGQYREQTTGTIINNPNFLSLWHVKKRPGNRDKWEWQPYQADLRITDNE